MFSQVCFCPQGEGSGRGGTPDQDRGTPSPPSSPAPPFPLTPQPGQGCTPSPGQYGLPSSVDSFPPSHSSFLPSPLGKDRYPPSPFSNQDRYSSSPSLLQHPPHLAGTGPGRLCDVGGMPLAFTQEDCLVIITNYFKRSLKTFLSEVYWL